MYGPGFRDRWQRFLLFLICLCLAGGSLAFALGADWPQILAWQLVVAVIYVVVAPVVVLMRRLRRNTAAAQLRQRVPGVRPLWLVHPPVLGRGPDQLSRQAQAYEEKLPGALGLTDREIVFLPLKQPLLRSRGRGLLGLVVGTLRNVRPYLLQRPTLQRWNRSAVEAALALPPGDLRMWVGGFERLRLQFKAGVPVDFACLGAPRLARLLQRELLGLAGPSSGGRVSRAQDKSAMGTT